MSVITILGLLLFILMVIFGGKKGVISYLTLFLNFVILLITVVMIMLGAHIYLVTLIFCIMFAACNLFVLNSYNIKTREAFYATILTTLCLIIGIYLSVSIGHLQGFTTEEQDETYVFSKIGRASCRERV